MHALVLPRMSVPRKPGPRPRVVNKLQPVADRVLGVEASQAGNGVVKTHRAAGQPQPVRKAFEITRLDQVIPLYDTVPEAVRALLDVR